MDQYRENLLSAMRIIAVPLREDRYIRRTSRREIRHSNLKYAGWKYENGLGRHLTPEELAADGAGMYVMDDPTADAVTDENLTRAMTLNENLKGFGWTLAPKDIVWCAKYPEVMPELYKQIKELTPQVTADPMYPDFPNQVMEMSEAQFRFDQLLHYFSTYGIEALTGTEVSRGWLPPAEKTDKVKEDKTLLRAKTLELTEEQYMYSLPLQRIAEKRERMTLQEKTILSEIGRVTAQAYLDAKKDDREAAGKILENPYLWSPSPTDSLADRWEGLRKVGIMDEASSLFHSPAREVFWLFGRMDTHEFIPMENYEHKAPGMFAFKENAAPLFVQLVRMNEAGRYIAAGDRLPDMEADTRIETADVLRGLCANSGDAMRCIGKYMDGHGWHLATSEKKLFSHLIDIYRPADLQENLSLSEKKRDRNIEILKRIDYAKYTHDMQSAIVFRDAKNLTSWEAQARKEIENRESGALEFVSKRPGQMLRMLSMINRAGYGEKEIEDALKKNAEKLSTQSLLSVLNAEPGACANQYNRQKEDRLGSEIYKAAFAAEHSRSPEKAKYAKAQAEKTTRQKARMKEKEKERQTAREDVAEAVRKEARAALREKLRAIDTPLRGKKVAIKEGPFDLGKMIADPARNSRDGGYIPSSTPYEIPADAKIVRAFVYWNDRNRVDVDLHALAETKDGNDVHIGWNKDYRAKELGLVFSGDITHSNAAEYIDIDVQKTDARYVGVSLDLYSGENKFSEVETAFAGLMAVKETGEDVKLYSPKNCFFTQDMKNVDSRGYQLGFIDVQERKLYFIGKETEREVEPVMPPLQGVEEWQTSVKDYLEMLLEEQGAENIGGNERDADIVLTLTKPETEKEVSLLDNNFFYDARPAEEERVPAVFDKVPEAEPERRDEDVER